MVLQTYTGKFECHYQLWFPMANREVLFRLLPTQLPPPREMVQSHNHANQFVSWIYILLASEPFL